MSLNVFISHSHDDKAIADSLKHLVADVFAAAAQRPRLQYSSDDSLGGGPDPLGAGWLDWILDQVRKANVCVVILTPDSLTSSWLMWEAGAVIGAALTESSSARSATVVPLLCGIGTEAIPAPLRSRRAVDGTSPRVMMQFLHNLHATANSKAETSTEFPSQLAEQRCRQFVHEIEKLLEDRIHPMQLVLAEGSPIYFVNSEFRLPMQPQEGLIRNSERLVCERFSGEPHQAWRLQAIRRGVFSILSHDRSRCISVQDDSPRPNAPLMLWEYEADESQHWRLEVFQESQLTPDMVRIVNCASTFCIAAWPSSKDVRLIRPGDHSNEYWWVLVAPKIKTKE